MDRIFEITGLDELRDYLTAAAAADGCDALRERLYELFLSCSCYRNAAEWNAAVRVCEALAIVGWGGHEPVEAIRGVYFNGNPNTCFLNRDSQPRFLDAVWSKRRDGLCIDTSLSFFHDASGAATPAAESGAEAQDVALCSQRNWIPKNPIRLVRGISNCYEGSKAMIDSLRNELIPALNSGMRPELYGTEVDMIVFNLAFSFYDNYHCKTNYIIADEALKLKKKDFDAALLGMFPQQEIADNGYYLRNRFTYGPFRKESGRLRVDIVFEREFSRLPAAGQKRLLSDYLLHAASQVAKRLERKAVYDFALMIADLRGILECWCGQPLS